MVWAGVSQGQLLINEVCSKNFRSVADQFDRNPDWIELHNAGSSTVQLGDHYLSDRVSEPGMWRLPELLLEPGGHAVFFAAHSESGNDHFPFGISQDGESVFLFSQTLQLVDRMDIPALRSDHSVGKPPGAIVLRIFEQSTPGMPNTTTSYTAYAPIPTASIAPGHVPAGTTLFLNASGGSQIRTTLTGMDPDETSPLYAGSLGIPVTMVVKAQSSLPDHLPSDVLTATYFVNESQGLPVISISVDPDTMFHEEFGLYMEGPNADTLPPFHGANFWSDRNIMARMEFFDELGRQGHVQQVDLRMHGGTQARTRPQRSLRLTGRKRYGNDLIEFPFFPERGRFDQYKHIVLRNSGGDFCLAHFRDGFWHQTALHADLDIDVLAFRPVRVFINGEYWGLMNLRERLSPEDVALNHGVEREGVLFMDQENRPIQGDSIHFAQLHRYIVDQDLTDPIHFAYVDSLLDLKSLKDYFALEIFAGNVDWPSNNIRAWKPSVNDGKWRYVMHDLDATMNVYGWIPMDVDLFQRIEAQELNWMHSAIFQELLENGEFERTFINRLADLMNTALTNAELKRELDEITNATDVEALRHYSRWSCDWTARLIHAGELIPEFFRVRSGHVQQHVLDRFELPNTSSLTFQCFPPGAGTIALNTIAPELPFNGIYFNGNAIDLNAEPAEDHVFDHWRFSGTDGTLGTSPVLRHEFTVDGTITAHFRKKDQPLHAFPVPCVDELFASVECPLDCVAELRLSDMHGRLVNGGPIQLHAGVNQIQLNMSAHAPGVYILAVEQPAGISSVRVVKTRP